MESVRASAALEYPGPREIDRLVQDTDAGIAALVMELANIWWGTGVRVTGRLGREMNVAIGATCGLLWTKRNESSAIFREIHRLYRDIVAGSRIRSAFLEARGDLNELQQLSWALRLFDHLVTGGAELERLRRVTNDLWGMSAPTTFVRKRLDV